MDMMTPQNQFSAFLPVCLVAISSLILLTWNLKVVREQYATGMQISAQQKAQLAQATQAEAKLKQMMTDLLDLSKADTDAETIVKRYGISFNPAPAAATAKPPVSR